MGRLSGEFSAPVELREVYMGMDERRFQYRVIPSDRRSIAIQITIDGEVLVRCPRGMRAEDVRAFVESKSDWIGRHMAQRAAAPRLPAFSHEEIDCMANEALRVIPERVAYFAPLVGVTYGGITIRNQRSRWGSCSDRGNLNFNCLLMRVPPEVMDYVVVHELCHRKEMNHSGRFWAEVERVLPDYRVRREWLKEHGGALIGRLTEAPE